MLFPAPLIHGTLIKRYKRFMADVTLDDGQVVTAHLANSGAMTGTAEPGMEVWLSPAANPDRKLKYSWELVRADGALVGVNTAHPNLVAAEAIAAGAIPQLAGYDSIRREVKYGANSRIDLLLEAAGRPPCYVEVKNVHLKQGDHALFPDAVTVRGAKHLVELRAMVAQGARAVMLYLVQRGDCRAFAPAEAVDPAYAAGLRAALEDGVEAICYTCHMSLQGISIGHELPIHPRGTTI